MKKIGAFFTTQILALVVTGCSYSVVAPQVQLQKLKTVQGNIVISSSEEASDIKDLNNFLDAVNNGSPANLEIKRFTIEGDPIIQTLEYNKGVIRYNYDDSQDKFGGTNKGIKTYEYTKVIKEENVKSVFITLIDKNGVKTQIALPKQNK